MRTKQGRWWVSGIAAMLVLSWVAWGGNRREVVSPENIQAVVEAARAAAALEPVAVKPIPNFTLPPSSAPATYSNHNAASRVKTSPVGPYSTHLTITMGETATRCRPLLLPGDTQTTLMNCVTKTPTPTGTGSCTFTMTGQPMVGYWVALGC